MSTENLPTNPDFEQIYYVKESLWGVNDHPIRRPFACICLRGWKTDNGWVFARGVSICSLKDCFEKTIGRKKAIGVLSAGVNRTARIFSEDLLFLIDKIHELADGLNLSFADPEGYTDTTRRTHKLYYMKAEFGLSEKDLTNFEKSLIKRL